MQADWQLFEKAVDLTGLALRGSMGADGSQPPTYAADLFQQVWGALKEAVAELPDKPKAGF